MNNQNVASLKNKLNMSTWHLVLLSLVTNGIYLLMWMYKNQDVIMTEVKQQFSTRIFIIWMAICTGVANIIFIYFPVQVDRYGYAYDSSAETIAGIGAILSIAWTVLTIVWAFKARAALQQYALTQFRFELKMNIAWTILFHVFYINYCINAMPEALAKHQIIHGKPEQPGTDNLPQP